MESAAQLPDTKLLAPLLTQAAIQLNCSRDNLMWRTWMHTFPTTGGPAKGGLHGQAFSTFQVYGFEDSKTGKRVKYCARLWADWDGVPKGW